jgi:glycosyltransferase involved in cell wall biosynthesis
LDRPWLVKKHQPILDKSLPYRIFWQKFKLSKLATELNCDVLFVPGGLFLGKFSPIVTMSRNMLPFEWNELKRYGWSLFTLKMILLRRAQSNTFRRVDGLIFLTQYAKKEVSSFIQNTKAKTTIIPHGVDTRFKLYPKIQQPLANYTKEQPYRIIYVSIIDFYKHQWHVIRAVKKLKEEGLPIEIELIGPFYKPALNRLRQTMDTIKEAESFIKISGAVPYIELHKKYANADLCLFASSCENMPNILLEGMASGLPIACSNRGPMPEILGEAGVYFDPENVESIFNALKNLICSPELRTSLAQASYVRVEAFTWHRCAKETLAFLNMIANEHHFKSQK